MLGEALTWSIVSPAVDSPALTAADVANDLPKVEEILGVVAMVLDQMSPF